MLSRMKAEGKQRKYKRPGKREPNSFGCNRPAVMNTNISMRMISVLGFSIELLTRRLMEPTMMAIMTREKKLLRMAAHAICLSLSHVRQTAMYATMMREGKM